MERSRDGRANRWSSAFPGSYVDAVLRRVANDVFDEALSPALVAKFLRDPRHHLSVAIDEGVTDYGRDPPPDACRGSV
jgi:hypothetical protein